MGISVNAFLLLLMAPMAATAEHLFPLLILIGLATRFSALALLGMTLVIQLFVYPGAYATHGTWAAVLLVLIARGPGMLSVDHWLGEVPFLPLELIHTQEISMSNLSSHLTRTLASAVVTAAAAEVEDPQPSRIEELEEGGLCVAEVAAAKGLVRLGCGG